MAYYADAPRPLLRGGDAIVATLAKGPMLIETATGKTAKASGGYACQNDAARFEYAAPHTSGDDEFRERIGNGLITPCAADGSPSAKGFTVSAVKEAGLKVSDSSYVMSTPRRAGRLQRRHGLVWVQAERATRRARQIQRGAHVPDLHRQRSRCAEGRVGTKAWQLFAESPDIIAARVNGELKDLAYELAEGDTVEGVAIDSTDGRDILRHSTAHVMAQAVQELFPDAKLGIGPPITDGFYYDFDVEEPFVPEDLEKIETRMRKIIKEGQKFDRREISDDAARKELADEPYKLELIGLKSTAGDAAEGASVEVGEGGLTIYDNLKRDGSVAWSDLCRGPHLPTTKRIPAFKLMRSAAAYWRGDEKNKQLQRIYGTAWETKEALDEHLHRIEEAQRRDHRRLGQELDLYSFPDEIGSGLPVFHPRGGVIKREMEDYVRRRHIEEGFEYVGTPHIAKEELFYTSGHLPYYGEGMFPPLELDGGDYRLKAMNCPMHNLIFRSRQRSYRELPLRLFEFGHVYRNEKSGVIHGLTRVRGFAQDDSHSYVTPEQAPAEIKHLLEFCLSLFRDFGLDDFYLELSTRDDSKPDKFIGSDEEWAVATKVLEDVCLETGLELVPDPGRRRLLRAQGLGAGSRRDRPHLADVDDPVRLQHAVRGAVQPRVRRRRRHAPAAGDDPLGEVRLDRAVHRRAGRALRRRVPSVARARAGRWHPGRRAARRLPVRARHPAQGQGHPGRGRQLRRAHAEEDPQCADPEGPVHADRRRRRHRGRCRVVPLSQR